MCKAGAPYHLCTCSAACLPAGIFPWNLAPSLTCTHFRNPTRFSWCRAARQRQLCHDGDLLQTSAKLALCIDWDGADSSGASAWNVPLSWRWLELLHLRSRRRGRTAPGPLPARWLRTLLRCCLLGQRHRPWPQTAAAHVLQPAPSIRLPDSCLKHLMTRLPMQGHKRPELLGT